MTRSDAVSALGAFLTADEARGIAALLEVGEHTTRALMEVNQARRQHASSLLAAAALGHGDREHSVAVLAAIAGAKSSDRPSTPVWTMPGNEADLGRLTGEFHRLVTSARMSITCATYNFETSSKMWDVLREASEQPGLAVVVYVDGKTADCEALKAQMPKVALYRSAALPDGKRFKSHAKFVVIDHRQLLLTSANFSYSAEKLNVEFGLLLDDAELAGGVESMMASKHGSLYELV